MSKHALAVPVLALSFGLPFGGVALAEGQGSAGPSAPEAASQTAASAERMFIPMQSGDQILANSLIGAHVVDAGGSEIGTVKDLILAGNGRAVGYVVSFGGMLGFGEKQVGIPFARTEISSTEKGDGKVLRLEISKDEFDSAPEFKDVAAQESDRKKSGGTGSESRM